MKNLIYLCGLHSLSFAIFHMTFWKLFNWKTDLRELSYVNSSIIQLLNMRIIYVFLFVAFICFIFPTELLNSKLGNVFLTGMSIFWIGRTFDQFIFMKTFNRSVKIMLTLFIIGATLFIVPVLYKHGLLLNT